MSHLILMYAGKDHQFHSLFWRENPPKKTFRKIALKKKSIKFNNSAIGILFAQNGCLPKLLSYGAPRAKPLPTGGQAWFSRDAHKGRTSRTRGPIRPGRTPACRQAGAVLLVRDQRNRKLAVLFHPPFTFLKSFLYLATTLSLIPPSSEGGGGLIGWRNCVK
jgi:hypothetical protein